MESLVANEFQLGPFAEFYDLLSDSFIDIDRVTDSLKLYLLPGSKLFEIGLGTGYFASKFTADGYTVKGIQPQDEMLIVLKRKYPEIEIVAESKLEHYIFEQKHDTIISHSSVFLFTRHQSAFGQNGEMLISYIFQSFIKTRSEALRCLDKTLLALAPGGRMFINIQSNPLPIVMVNNGDDQMKFEMSRCDYFLELGYVEKTFRLTYAGQTYQIDDMRSCETYSKFADHVSRLGFDVSVSADEYWVIVKKKKSK
jgi:hypothetical protein